MKTKKSINCFFITLLNKHKICLMENPVIIIHARHFSQIELFCDLVNERKTKKILLDSLNENGRLVSFRTEKISLKKAYKKQLKKKELPNLQYIVIWGWVKSFAISLYYETQFGSSGWFAVVMKLTDHIGPLDTKIVGYSLNLHLYVGAWRRNQ